MEPARCLRRSACVLGVTAMLLCSGVLFAIMRGSAASADEIRGEPPPSALQLSLDEALSLFLRQNLDVLLTRTGIDAAKGREITARLFPNPVLAIDTGGAFTQGQRVSRTGFLAPQLRQLFETAGKRGYRMQSAGLGTQSTEAHFEDTLRQLRATVKETYFHVQVARRRLVLAEENRTQFDQVLDIAEERARQGLIADIDLVRIRLQKVDFDAQGIQFLQEAETAQSDLRVLLNISPVTDLILTTPLNYGPVNLEIKELQRMALDARPDLREKQLQLSQREAELKLAKAYRYPDVVAGSGLLVQGPEGPDNQQQMHVHLSVPIPLFNRNQGGIVQAEAALQAAQAELAKTLLEVSNQVDIAYRNLVQSQRLVEAYRAGVLDDARSMLVIVERLYEKGAATLFDLLDGARTERTIEQNYSEALFQYQRNLFRLESAVGREIRS